MDGGDRDPRRQLDEISRGLERFLLVFLAAVAGAVLVIAVSMMASIDGGSRSQGGRLYVAVGALVVLGALDTQFDRVMRRRLPLLQLDTPEYRRYRIGSLLFLFLAAIVLFGLALRLP